MIIGGFVLGAMLLLASAPATTTPAEQPSVPVDRRGLDIGAKIPVFQAMDQFGKTRTFDTLAGPSGLVLLFVRSADW